MKLLAPEQVKEEKDTKIVEKESYLQKLRNEENTLIKRISRAKEIAEKEIEKIESNLAIVKDKAKTELAKSVLLQEIESLEKRREKLLEPIYEKEKQANDFLEESKKTFADANAIKESLKKDRDDFAEEIYSLKDQKDEIMEKNREIDKRESRVELAENEIKRSTDVLSNKWIEFHKSVAEFANTNSSISKKLERDKKSLDLRSKNQDIRNVELQKKELSLSDRENALIAANDEFERKKKERREDLEKREALCNKQIADNNHRTIALDTRESEIIEKERILLLRESVVVANENRTLESSKSQLKIIEAKNLEIDARLIKAETAEKNNEQIRQRLSEEKQLIKGMGLKLNDREKIIANRELFIIKSESEISGKLTFAKNLESESIAKFAEADKREKESKKIELEAKEILEKVLKDKNDFENYVKDITAQLELKTKEIDDSKKSNESFKQSLERVEKEQEESWRAIKDGYDALEKAKKEILGNNGTS